MSLLLIRRVVLPILVESKASKEEDPNESDDQQEVDGGQASPMHLELLNLTSLATFTIEAQGFRVIVPLIAIQVC